MRKQILTVGALAVTIVLGGRTAMAGQAGQAARPDAGSDKSDKKVAGSASATPVDPGAGTKVQSAKRFGQLETVTGLITLVVRTQGLLVVTLAAKTPPKTLSVDSKQYDSVEGGHTMHHKVTTTVTQSADVNYAFRVTNDTRIWLGRKRVRLRDLRDLKNKPATIRFVPQPSGDFAEVIDIR